MRELSNLARISELKQFYIFVTSWQPDPYVNVLVHALQEWDLSKVYFVSIAEHDYVIEEDPKEVDRSLSDIKAGIDRRLKELAEGHYTRRPKVPGGLGEVVDIGLENAELYKNSLSRLENLEVTTVTVRWADLDRKLADYSEGGSGIFDVTALKNNLLVDVVINLLSRGCSEIFAFEILKKGQRSFDEKDLVHNLKTGGKLTEREYVYRNMLRNSNVRGAVRRIVTRSLALRSSLIITAIIGVVIIFVQIFFSKSWPGTAVGVAVEITAVAGWVFAIKS